MGDGGLVMTIPKSWAAYYQLKAGDKVLVIANGELKIRPQGKQQERDLFKQDTEGGQGKE